MFLVNSLTMITDEQSVHNQHPPSHDEANSQARGGGEGSALSHPWHHAGLPGKPLLFCVVVDIVLGFTIS